MQPVSVSVSPENIQPLPVGRKKLHHGPNLGFIFCIVVGRLQVELSDLGHQAAVQF